MSPNTAHKRPTYADIEALPPHLRGEILAGELVVSPRPSPPHVRVGSSLGGLLFGFDRDDEGDGPGGWWIDDEPELHLDVDPDDPVVVPDLAGWRVHATPSAGQCAAPAWQQTAGLQDSAPLQNRPSLQLTAPPTTPRTRSSPGRPRPRSPA